MDSGYYYMEMWLKGYFIINNVFRSVDKGSSVCGYGFFVNHIAFLALCLLDAVYTWSECSIHQQQCLCPSSRGGQIGRDT